MAKFGTSQIELDTTKIIYEDDKEIVIPAILAREGVLPYDEGKAFRPKEELEKSAFSFEGAWCTSKRHPPLKILTKPYEITGRVTDTTYDAARTLVKGNVHLLKAKNDSGFIEDVKSGRLKDVSMGFLFEDVWTPGEFQGQKYDYVQRNILVNHIAVGVPVGRMRSPAIGLGLDAVLEDILNSVTVAADPWEENENTIRSGHGPAAEAETCRTKVLSEEQGISLVVCKNKNTGKWYDQSFLFTKAKGWTLEKAKSWFQSHTGNDASAWFVKAEVDELARSLGHVTIAGAADSSGSAGSSQTATAPPPAGQQPSQKTGEGKPPGTQGEKPPATKTLPSAETLLAENKRLREIASKLL